MIFVRLIRILGFFVAIGLLFYSLLSRGRKRRMSGPRKMDSPHQRDRKFVRSSVVEEDEQTNHDADDR